MMTVMLHATPDNPVPPQAHAGTFEGSDGRRLRYAIFRSETEICHGTVLLLQGRNETIEKYYETIGDLTARGLWVATFDWRGQGASERLMKHVRRGHVRRFSDYEDDLRLFMDHIVLPDTRRPFFLLAHSMGCLVALSLAPELEGRIDRMVLCAPFIHLGGQIIRPGLVAVLARMTSTLGLGSLPLSRERQQAGFERNLLTTDPQRFARNMAIAEHHPELFLAQPSGRWLHELLSAIRRVTVRGHLTRIHIPTLVLAPGQDPLVPLPVFEAFARNFRAGHLIPIDGARHELLQEADRYRAQVLAAIEAFIPGTQGDDGSMGS